MAGVSWPDSWSRAYLTPVTLLAGRALLGTTVSSVRTGVIRDVNLAEYRNKQVLTFDWPSGAAAVVAHPAPKGYDPRNGLTGKSFEISLEEYEKYGGMQLSRQELPPPGARCTWRRSPSRRGAASSVRFAAWSTPGCCACSTQCGSAGTPMAGPPTPRSRCDRSTSFPALRVRLDQQPAAHPAVDARRAGRRRGAGQRTRPGHRGGVERTAVVGADHARRRRDVGGERARSARLDPAVREHALGGVAATIALLDPPVEHLRLPRRRHEHPLRPTGVHVVRRAGLRRRLADQAGGRRVERRRDANPGGGDAHRLRSRRTVVRLPDSRTSRAGPAAVGLSAHRCPHGRLLAHDSCRIGQHRPARQRVRPRGPGPRCGTRRHGNRASPSREPSRRGSRPEPPARRHRSGGPPTLRDAAGPHRDVSLARQIFVNRTSGWTRSISSASTWTTRWPSTSSSRWSGSRSR